MKKLKTGEYYGSHYQKSVFDDVVITDTEYTHSKVDWHYHENPYFTYLIQGKLFEANKKESYCLEAGSLLFHRTQDAHHNVKPPGYTRGFHIELSNNWLSEYGIQSADIEGSIHLKSPLIKRMMNSIFLESKMDDHYSSLTVQMLLLEIFQTIENHESSTRTKPDWVNRLQELIMEEPIDHSLKTLSAILQVHPVHLSREFSRYFGTTLGEYVRLQKLNKAVQLMAANKSSMTEICYECGFYDQSHFTSSFKRVYRTTPSKFLRKISKS